MKKGLLYLIFTAAVTATLLFFTISRSTSETTILALKPVGKPAELLPKAYEPTPDDLDFIEKFSRYIFETYEKTDVPGASVAIVKNGTVLFSKGFGVKSARGTDSVNTETLFRIASVSKGFSAILTGLMVRDSLIKWSDTMAAYLPYPLKGDYKKITVKHLLSHTGGFQYQAYSTLVEDRMPRDEMIERLLKLPLSREPGEIHSYQNVAFSIIERILESATRTPFNQLVRERIFEPLGMNTASICYDSMINSDNVAIPHGFRYRKFVPTKIDESYYNVAAAGGINASISDMAKWLKAVLGYSPDVIPPGVIQQVFDPVIRIRIKNSYFSQLASPRKGYYGLGWRIIEYPKDTLVFHGGYANGYKSGIALDCNQKIGICVLTNAPSKFSNLVLSNFFRMYNEHFDHEQLTIDS